MVIKVPDLCWFNRGLKSERRKQAFGAGLDPKWPLWPADLRLFQAEYLQCWPQNEKIFWRPAMRDNWPFQRIRLNGAPHLNMKIAHSCYHLGLQGSRSHGFTFLIWFCQWNIFPPLKKIPNWLFICSIKFVKVYP